MTLRVDFVNGDYVLLDKQQAIHYRKRLLTCDSLGYHTTIFHRNETYPCSPAAYSVRRAVTQVIEQKMLPVQDALQLFMPFHNHNYTVPDGFKIAATNEVDDVPMVQLEATRKVVFQHPLHPDDPDRTFIVEAETLSGWMPAHCINRNVWVDEDSSVGPFSHISHSIVTGVSKIGSGCTIENTWVRNSNIDDSSVLGSVIHKSSVRSSDVYDCGLRNSEIEECTIDHSSLSGCTSGVCLMDRVRAGSGNFLGSVLVQCTIDKGSVQASHLIRCKFSNGNDILASTLSDCDIAEASVISSKIESKVEQTFLHRNIFVFGVGRDGFVPKVSGELA